MFTGIITDRFTALREKLNEVKEDEKTKCFICGKSWEEIEKQGYIFLDHINGIHNKQNYIFFIDYILTKYKKAPHAMTSEEFYIYNLVIHED